MPKGHLWYLIPLVGCSYLLTKYIRIYPPYLEDVSSIRNLNNTHCVIYNPAGARRVILWPETALDRTDKYQSCRSIDHPWLLSFYLRLKQLHLITVFLLNSTGQFQSENVNMEPSCVRRIQKNSAFYLFRSLIWITTELEVHIVVNYYGYCPISSLVFAIKSKAEWFLTVVNENDLNKKY